MGPDEVIEPDGDKPNRDKGEEPDQLLSGQAALDFLNSLELAPTVTKELRTVLADLGPEINYPEAYFPDNQPLRFRQAWERSIDRVIHPEAPDLRSEVLQKVCTVEAVGPSVQLVGSIRDANGHFVLPYRNSGMFHFDERPSHPAYLIRSVGMADEFHPAFRFDTVRLSDDAMNISVARLESGQDGFWKSHLLSLWERAAIAYFKGRVEAVKAWYSNGACEGVKIRNLWDAPRQPEGNPSVSLWKFSVGVVPHATLTTLIGHDSDTLKISHEVLDFEVH